MVGVTLVLGCLLAPASLYLYKRYQEAQIAKMRRVAQLTHAYRLTQRFLHQIPAQYTTRQSKLLLLDRAIFFLNKLKKDIPNSALILSKIQRNQTMYSELEKGDITFSPAVIDTVMDARSAHNQLSEFCRFVEIQSRVNAIDHSVASEVINQTNLFLMQCLTDFYRKQSEVAFQNESYRLAIHHLNNEITELNKYPLLSETEPRIQTCLERLNHIKQCLLAQEQEAQDKPKDQVVDNCIDMEENVLLMKDWDKPDKKSNEFKKKMMCG